MLLILYIGLLTLLHVPSFQEKMGEMLSSRLSDYLGTEVHVGQVNYGLFNQFVISDLFVKDKLGKDALHVEKAAASIELLPLFRGEVVVSSAQLYGFQADIYKATPSSDYNIGFIIDKLSSKNDDEQGKTFKIESLAVRNGQISHHVLSEPTSEGVFDTNHLSVQDFNLVANISCMDMDSLDIQIKELQLKEKSSGLQVKQLTTHITSTADSLLFKAPHIALNNSNLQADEIRVSRNQTPTGIRQLTCSMAEGHVVPSDLSTFIPRLEQLTTSIDLSGTFGLEDDCLTANHLLLHTADGGISIDGDFTVEGISSKKPNAAASIRQCSFRSASLADYLAVVGAEEGIKEIASKLGDTEFSGKIAYADGRSEAIASLTCAAGTFFIDGTLDNSERLKAHITTPSLRVSQLLPTLDLKQIGMDMDVDIILKDLQHPTGILKGDISHIEYAQYHLNDIKVDGAVSTDGYKGRLTVNDPNLKMEFNGEVNGLMNKDYHIDAQLRVSDFKPSRMGMKGDFAKNRYHFNAVAKVSGDDLSRANGSLTLNDIKVELPKETYHLDQMSLSVENLKDGERNVTVESDILKGQLKGRFDYATLPHSLQCIPNAIMPVFGKSKTSPRPSNDNFAFSLTAVDHPLLHNLIKESFSFTEELNVSGSIDMQEESYHIQANTNTFTYNDIQAEDIAIDYQGIQNHYDILASGTYSDSSKTYSGKVNAEGNSHRISSEIDLLVDQDNPISGKLKLNGIIDQDKTSSHIATIHLEPSEIAVIEKLLHVQATSIDLFKDHLVFDDLSVENDNKSLTINGTLSNDSTDYLTADLNGTKIGSLFEIAGADVSDLNGMVYGNCKVYDILHSPRVDANMTIQDLQFKENNLGNAYILANWDRSQNAVNLRTQVIGEAFGDSHRELLLTGYVYPSEKELDLNLDCQHVDASLLNGLIGRTFRDISGDINGKVGIRGPLSDVQVLGDLSADASITLRATSVTYYISPKDNIRIGTNSIAFNKIHVSDKDGHTNIIDGYVTHKGFKDFTYKFDMNFKNMLAYEETSFNSDKFMGKVYGDGELHINGADGHPVYINIDLTPAKDSEFYYDAATPDAITGNSFISFRELTPTDSLLLSRNIDPGWYWSLRDTTLNSSSESAARRYRGDLFVNIGIHINHNCPIKLKMDNSEDGYITTYGTGTLRAEYYNKGSFTLNGTYNIQDGKYRLYLQDIIYRDLAIQNGSNVVFNGNPFDADIHLICWYTLNSVPLSDLTSVTYTQNNRVKVVCVLDITGKLGNMAFNFDLNLPNVSDETRSLVRSYISTEEEMNKQMIYLLGFGRFFTNEYARANGDSNTNQAVNNLLSSTLSGQINQILTNAVGNDSKWNFGTGLSTGERGWEDMDVEGTLSGKLLDDRLLINGNFGYRDNSMTNNSSFVGDFDVRWRMTEKGNTYLKAYNLTNDRYFTKSTLNTQGIGVSYQKDFESWKDLFRKGKKPISQPVEAKNDSLKSDNTSPKSESILILRKDTTNQ